MREFAYRNPFFPRRRNQEVSPCQPHRKHEILVVDDDAAIRDSLALVLKSGGYDATTAVNGFDALLQLKRRVPAIVLSDLNMPQMSGFEFLSVVRRRFPQISVIAMSGAYHSGESVPGGVIADAFYPKGHSDPETLLRIVADLIQTSAAHAVDHKRESAPVWIPRNGKDSHGIPYVVLTCTDCLRSFPLSVTKEDRAKNPGDTVPVLPQHGPICHRFFSGDCFSPAGSESSGSRSRCDESIRKDLAQLRRGAARISTSRIRLGDFRIWFWRVMLTMPGLLSLS